MRSLISLLPVPFIVHTVCTEVLKHMTPLTTTYTPFIHTMRTGAPHSLPPTPFKCLFVQVLKKDPRSSLLCVCACVCVCVCACVCVCVCVGAHQRPAFITIMPDPELDFDFEELM